MEALRDKMKYLRNYGNPSTSKNTDVGQTSKKERKPFVQFPHVLSEPSIPEGEDNHSNNRNQKMLLAEEKKVRPNKQAVSVLMERTFAFRRRDISIESISIT